MRPLTILDAPSNLGLRPPAEGSVPGCYKAGWALREAGLLDGLDVTEAGVVVPPRYEAAWTPGEGDRNGAAIASYSLRLADRMVPLLEEERFMVLLGGDCSVLVGAALALRRRGRYGVAYLDGHSDFRHPGNAPAVGAAAGEGLAILTGRGDERLVDLEGLGPSLPEENVVAVGMRPDDEYLDELGDVGVAVWPVERLRAAGTPAATRGILAHLDREDLEGFWVHLDVDILDPQVMPPVDTPTPGGLELEELAEVLSALVGHPGWVGLNVSIFDPDLDPDGRHARSLAVTLRDVLSA